MKSARSLGERALIIMGKAPRPGHVKTRLAASLPAEAVVDLYRCMIQDTLGFSLALSQLTHLLLSARPQMSPISPVGYQQIEIVGQHGEGLAAGLASAFRIFIDRGCAPCGCYR